MADAVSHDQNFKNIIVEYPRQALEFFAPGEAPEPGAGGGYLCGVLCRTNRSVEYPYRFVKP